MGGDTRRSSWVLPLVRLLVLAGLGISGYLLYLAVRGGVPAGCGEGDAGCAEVLASGWSSVLGVPVAGLALVVYLVLLFASVHAGEKAPADQRGMAWRVMAVVGVAAGASALWFIGLQVVVFEGVCPYCMVAHGCSLAIAGLAVWQARGWVPWFGVLPAAVLAGAQVFFPAFVSLASDLQGTDVSDLRMDTGPVLGDPGAPVQIVVLYDYNCRYCRSVHAGLRQALEQSNGELSALMLPTALDPACNHAVKKKNPSSGTSCELVHLALAVWIAAPEQFAAFDQRVVDTINTGPGLGSAEDIVQMLRAYATQLVGNEKLEAALKDTRLERQVDLAAELYARAVDPATGHRGLPRLIVSDRAYAGILNAKLLLDLLDQPR